MKLQQRLRSPAWQGGQSGSMPRGAQVSQGLSTTRCPTSSPRASGPRATTSATTSWPGTWGSEEKAAMGLSMSPVLKSPSTSLASDPQMPERMGLGHDPVGTDQPGVVDVVQAEGDARQHRLQLVLRGGPDLLLVGWCAEEQRLHWSVPAWPLRPRMPTMKLSMSDVFVSMIGLHVGQVVLELLAVDGVDDAGRRSPPAVPWARRRGARRCRAGPRSRCRWRPG